MRGDIVLDTHGLTEWARRRPPIGLLAVLEAGQRAGGRAVVPTAVLVEALTGGPADAAVRHRLRRALRHGLDEPTAVAAAGLRARAPAASVVDAVVAATAVRVGAAAVVTSDPRDLRALLADADVWVEAL